jgi:hypothetical protein
MKNKERIIWAVALLFIGIMLDRTLSKLNSSDILSKNYELSFKIQQDQILEFYNHLEITKSSEYEKGFNQGKLQAMLALMDNKSLIEYSEGYHAALSQFSIDNNNSK